MLIKRKEIKMQGGIVRNFWICDDIAADYQRFNWKTYEYETVESKTKVESPDGTLNLRAGASTSKTLIEVMPNGTVVRCYGYYTVDWLFVVSASGKKGFCHRSYLRKI